MENKEKCENEKINKDENWEMASKFLGVIFGISDEKRKKWTEQAKRDYYINKDGESRCRGK